MHFPSLHSLTLIAVAGLAFACAQPPETGSAENHPMSDSTRETSSAEPGEPGKTEVATFGAGCFWCVEAVLEQLDGVESVTSGYMGGTLADPSYAAVCTGKTGHAEVVQVRFDPSVIGYGELLDWFWRLHDPTTLNRQGPDTGTQYRSVIFVTSPEQGAAAEASKAAYQRALTEAGHGVITTDVAEAPTFYYAEDYHQQYLSKNPNGYCGLGGTGVTCPIGLGV